MAGALPGSDVTPDSNGGLDVDTLMNSFNLFSGSINASISDLANAVGQGNAAAKQAQQGIQQESEGTQELNTLKAATTAKLNADNAASAAAFGTNPNTDSYVLNSMGESILADEVDLQRRQAIIQQKADASFFDDPLSWVSNQFTLPMDVYGANVKEANIMHKLEVVKKLTESTTDAAVANAVSDQTDAEKAALIQNKIVAGAAQEKMSESAFKLANLTLSGLTIRDARDKAGFDAIYQLNNALAQKENFKLETRKTEAYIVQAEATSDMRNMQAEINRQNEEDKKSLQGKLDKATIVLGMSKIPINEFFKMSGKLRTDLEYAMNNEDIQQGNAGPNTAVAIHTANDLNAPMTPGINTVRKIANNWMLEAHSDPLWSTFKPVEQSIKEQEKVDAHVEAELANIHTVGGIYSPISTNKAITANPTIAAMPLSKELSPYAIANPNMPLKADDVFAAARSMIANGKLTPAAASQQISIIYQGMQMQLNSIHQYQRLQLPMLSAATGYKQSVYFGDGWRTSDIIDMANPVAIETALIRSMTPSALEHNPIGGPTGSAPQSSQPATNFRNYTRAQQQKLPPTPPPSIIPSVPGEQ